MRGKWQTRLGDILFLMKPVGRTNRLPHATRHIMRVGDEILTHIEQLEKTDRDTLGLSRSDTELIRDIARNIVRLAPDYNYVLVAFFVETLRLFKSRLDILPAWSELMGLKWQSLQLGIIEYRFARIHVIAFDRPEDTIPEIELLSGRLK